MTERTDHAQHLDDQARGLAAVIIETTDLQARKQLLERLLQEGANPRIVAGLAWWLAYWVDQILADPDPALDELHIAAQVAIATTPRGLADLDEPPR